MVRGGGVGGGVAVVNEQGTDDYGNGWLMVESVRFRWSSVNGFG